MTVEQHVFEREHELLTSTMKKLEDTQKAYNKERVARMEAEQAADFLFQALTECECDGDVRRAYKVAEKRWPWLG